jgi:glycoprotease/Kae1 family metallohydrolase
MPAMELVRPLVLAIETSCDDTACAVVDGEGRVLASSVSSQLAAHRPYGGVVPEIASREHLANWPAVAATALSPLGLAPRDADLVAATRGPGLVGALLVGLSLGKALAYALGKPFFGVHHLEGHLWSPFLATGGEPAAAPPQRFAALVVSGGHTALYGVDGGAVTTLAETRDDAMGEVFDKLGKRLGLAYPQGPLVDKLAETGDPQAAPLPVPRVEGELFFSYSGLKSAAIRRLEALERGGLIVDPPTRRSRSATCSPPSAPRGGATRRPRRPPATASGDSTCSPSPAASPPTASCAASWRPGRPRPASTSASCRSSTPATTRR